MSRKKTAELDTPFSNVEWPSIPQEDQDGILELLCTLLEPLGQHRRNHVKPSHGKRSRRRDNQKQKVAAAGTDSAQQQKEHPPEPKDGEAPPPPALAAFVDVGLANITRVLADSTAASVGRAAEPTVSETTEPEKLSPEVYSPDSPPYTAVFVVRSGHPSAFYSHFPQMVAAASHAKCGKSVKDKENDIGTGPSESKAIRLVGFSRSCEEKLSACLGIPRVSSIALRVGAPQSQGLVQYLREHVPPIELRWLAEAQEGQHRETQIHIAEVNVGQKKKRKAQ